MTALHCKAMQCIGSAMQTVIVIQELSFESLRQELERERGAMPSRTLYSWISKMGIIRNSEGFYTSEDLELLKRLYRFLKRVPSINKFRKVIYQEQNTCH